jgi:nucleoid-associated protein YgaU
VRLWLAAAILLACFALGLSLLRREGTPEAPSAAPAPASPLPPGWGSVVLGAPSGALPPAAEPQAPAPAPAPVPAPVPEAPPPEARSFELVVSPGQSLSTICKEHYGTASTALVEALARFNGLKSPDALRAGQKLELPPLATLQKP